MERTPFNKGEPERYSRAVLGPEHQEGARGLFSASAVPEQKTIGTTMTSPGMIGRVRLSAAGVDPRPTDRIAVFVDQPQRTSLLQKVRQWLAGLP